MIHFPISDVETYWWLPVVVAFFISSLTSTGGISGAFLLLPFQVSILGFTSPAVSSTNLLYNIFAIPSGVYRYWREKRLVMPLVITIILGTIPGALLGVILRIKLLPNPRHFKFFVGMVLLYLAIRLLSGVAKKKPGMKAATEGRFLVEILAFTIYDIRYRFEGREYRISTPVLFVICLAVGIIGGTYGIGGGAIIAPILVTAFGLPVHTIAGAALMGTFVSSIAGVIFYTAAAPFFSHTGLAITPDWMLGGMFGIGGAGGMYVGARLQKYLPGRVIKIILTLCILIVVVKYVLEFFR